MRKKVISLDDSALVRDEDAAWASIIISAYLWLMEPT